MKARIFNNMLAPILPEDADPDEMGRIYDVSVDDTDTYYESLQLVKMAEENFRRINERIIRKLQREQGN